MADEGVQKCGYTPELSSGLTLSLLFDVQSKFPETSFLQAVIPAKAGMTAKQGPMVWMVGTKPGKFLRPIARTHRNNSHNFLTRSLA
jgi:hypothetical protein